MFDRILKTPLNLFIKRPISDIIYHYNYQCKAEECDRLIYTANDSDNKMQTIDLEAFAGNIHLFS